MGQTTVSTSIVTTTENLPAEVSTLSQHYGLTVSESHDVQELMLMHETNLPSISRLLDDGLSVAEVGEVYETRDRINTALEGSLRSQSISLTAIVAFQRQFPELPLDSDSLDESMLDLHETVQDRYFTTALKTLTSAAQWHHHCFASTLAAFLNNELEEPDDI